MSTTDEDPERWRVPTSGSGGGGANGAPNRWHRDRGCDRLAHSTPVPASESAIEYHDLTPCGKCADGAPMSGDGEQDEDECPVCGDSTRSLGTHLRHRCDGGDA
jgi:hypothetical protein